MLKGDESGAEEKRFVRWLRWYYEPIDALGIMFAGCITTLAAAVAYIQFTSQWQLEHERQAKEAYRDFLKISLEYPQYSRPDLLARDFNRIEYERYFWYVNIMTQTFEQVFEFIPDSDNWNWIASEQFRLHCGFFSGEDYRPELYSDVFQRSVETMLEQIPETECYHVLIDFEAPVEE